MSIKIIATSVVAEELLPGDLFSTIGPDYWGPALEGVDGAVGERVYIRTRVPTPPTQVGMPVWRVEIVDDEPEPADLTDDQARRLFEAAVGVATSYVDGSVNRERLGDLREVVHEVLGAMEPEGGDA